MSIAKELEKLEDKYDIEEADQKEALLEQLVELHEGLKAKGGASLEEFQNEVPNYFMGLYIPHIFWGELGKFMEDHEHRTKLFQLVQAFADSGFDKDEKAKMKPLLITYFAVEKEFEIDKIQSLIVEKAHPSVQEYFRKIITFVELNKTSVEMYVDKFRLLANMKPDFEVLKMPLAKLRDQLGVGE